MSKNVWRSSLVLNIMLMGALSEWVAVSGATEVPGVVVNHSPAASGCYIGSPSIAVLSNGNYVASHDFFGPNSNYREEATTFIFLSTDQGATWQHQCDINGQLWSTLFVDGNILYIIGTWARYNNLVIRKSLDGGKTWSAPDDDKTGLLQEGYYHCAPVPVMIHNGRFWRAMEEIPEGDGGALSYHAFMMSAPVGSDLLDNENWRYSNRLSCQSSWMEGKFGGWLEGNAVVDPDGELCNVLRIYYPDGRGKAAIMKISADGLTASFDPETDFVDLPGGCSKFAIRYDPVSNVYWALSNVIPPHHLGGTPTATRNTLGLIRSSDLRNWEVRSYLLYHPDVNKHGFQYPDWLFDGEDIIAVSRTAYDDGQGGANNFHDANYLTFHRIKNFRSLREETEMLLSEQFSAASVGHFELNGDLSDSAPLGDNPTGVFGGNAAFTSAARFGSNGVTFDGNGDYISLGDSFDVSSNDLTVAAWVKTTNKAFARIVSKEGAGGFNISLHATDGVGCTLNSTYHYFTATYEDNTYHHLAATYDRDGDATVYWDGEPIGSFDISSLDGIDLNNANSLYFGWRSTGGTGAFNGIIDDVRIYNEVLSAQEVRDLVWFSSHFTFDSTTTNSATIGPFPVGIRVGDAVYTNDARVGSHALALDGDGDYVNFGNVFDIGTSDWTVSCWMKTSVKEFARLVTKQRWALATGSAGDMSIILDGSSFGGIWQFHTFPPIGTYYDNRFHHVAAVFDRDDTVTMYWDGMAIGSEDITTNAAINIYDSWPMMIGARYNYGSPDAEFNGIIDDVRLYNRVLPREEIQDLFLVQKGTQIRIQ